MLETDKHICPRCFGWIPSNERPGEYIGALSRIDNKTQICSACGNEEAILALVPTDQWPIILYDDPVTNFAKQRWLERIVIQERTSHGPN